MKFTIDTKIKVITLLEEVNMKELYSWMNKIGIDGWKIEPYVEITIAPFNPSLPYAPFPLHPYDPYHPFITCDTSNKDDFIG